MQFNAASASSFTAGSASGVTRNYFGAAVDVDVDGFKIPQLPLAGPSHQPITNNQIPKNADSLSPSKKIATRLGGDVRFPSPGSSAEDEIAGSQSPSPNPFQSIRPASRLARSVAPSPAPTTLQRIHKDIGCLYAFEAEQGEEIKTLAKEVLFAAYKVWLSTPGDLSSRYCAQIAEILGEGVEKRTVKDTEEIKEMGRLPERTPSWDMGYLGRSTTHALHNVTTPTRSSMPPPSFIPSRKRLREEDSLEDVLEVENSLSLSRNPSINTISSSEDSPAAKRPRLETYEPTIDEREDDAMLGLIWGRYFSTTQEDGDDGEYSPSDNEMEDVDEAECNSDMEVEEEDLSRTAGG
ncbi:hypothetical protein NLJ89_g8138 [Agrocybe chaxingu]|uniref:Uncharacterized protein n=1 Tax=Agrocybe chaxingu TaxID=84603 RepID=A0A9W8MSF6_9AGAR|nr:hypothetical protein NLJ89_g8138 [Agrocybe chaxingu]